MIWRTVRQNYLRTKSIYAKRAQLIQRIPNFWAIVIEEAPEEIDSRIQPCDTAALSALKSIEVTRFEISQSAPEAGDPRSVKIALTFGENAWFTDRTLEKTFWYRTARDGWTGLVSEPVQIHWKEGKDLTEGILDDAIEIFKFENGMKEIQGSIAGSQEGPSALNQQSKLHQQLVQKLSGKIEEMPQDALSFFTWFGYRGRNVSAEESAKAVLKGNQKRDRWNNGENTVPGDGDDMVDDDDEAEKKNLDYEIYPAGEDLAIGISEDLFPSAIKYFSELFFLSKQSR